MEHKRQVRQIPPNYWQISAPRRGGWTDYDREHEYAGWMDGCHRARVMLSLPSQPYHVVLARRHLCDNILNRIPNPICMANLDLRPHLLDSVAGIPQSEYGSIPPSISSSSSSSAPTHPHSHPHTTYSPTPPVYHTLGLGVLSRRREAKMTPHHRPPTSNRRAYTGNYDLFTHLTLNPLNPFTTSSMSIVFLSHSFPYLRCPTRAACGAVEDGVGVARVGRGSYVLSGDEKDGGQERALAMGKGEGKGEPARDAGRSHSAGASSGASASGEEDAHDVGMGCVCTSPNGYVAPASSASGSEAGEASGSTSAASAGKKLARSAANTSCSSVDSGTKSVLARREQRQDAVAERARDLGEALAGGARGEVEGQRLEGGEGREVQEEGGALVVRGLDAGVLAEDGGELAHRAHQAQALRGVHHWETGSAKRTQHTVAGLCMAPEGQALAVNVLVGGPCFPTGVGLIPTAWSPG
ncbi:hypothetical protein DFH09DRAFT_1112212 [Mycena vulgaris]|nr:hypothetical protein DFH09DRAFT_1112212 [Mycena vulgaris]